MNRKIKLNGQKVTVRQMTADEIINERSMYAISPYNPDSDLKSLKFTTSCCIGEKVGDHRERIYVEVLSKWFKLRTEHINES